MIQNAEEGDYISSQYGYSVYADGEWEGDFDVLIPGSGYLYKSASAKTLEFDFTKTIATTDAPHRVATRTEEDMDTPRVDIHKYPNTMNVTARLYNENGSELSDEGYRILAYCGDELRGVGKKVNDNYYITIYGDEAVEIVFMIEDLVDGVTYHAAEPLTFVSDVIGSRKEPYTIVVGEEITGVSSTYADEDSKRIFRLDGTTVPVKNQADLLKGIYVINGKKIVK